LSTNEFDLSVSGFESGGGSELGLGDGLLDELIGSTLGDGLELGESLRSDIGNLSGGSLDRNTEETSIRVGEVEGLSGNVGRGEFGERGRTSRPLDRRFTTEEVTEDSEFGRGGGSTFEGDEELVYGRVADGGDADFTTEVFRGGRGDGGRRGSAGNEEFANEGFELGSVNVGSDDSEVGGREGGLGEGSDGRMLNSGVRGGEEGVSESVSECKLVGEVESVSGRIPDSLLVFSGDLRNDFFSVLVRGELGLGDSISESLCEVSPNESCHRLSRQLAVRSSSLKLQINSNSLVTLQELGGKDKVFPRERR
jgi:hypothetical protein